MTDQMLTLVAFMRSYDRDVLDLQDDPTLCISDLEVELELCYPNCSTPDTNGTKVWPIGVLKAHLQITGEPLWPEPLALAAT